MASIIKLIKKDAWWIRFFDFPQVQLVIMCIISIIGLFYSWDMNEVLRGSLILLLVGVMVYECIIIFPYTWLAPSESRNVEHVPDDNRLSLLVANVFMYNRSFQRCIDLVWEYKPDLLLLLETDTQWLNAMETIEGDYPYTMKYPLANAYGIALYSKFELINPEVKFLIEPDVPSIHTDFKLANGERVRLYAIHPKPPSPTENDESTERDAELYLIAKMAKPLKMPVIVAGDLNDVAWSYTTRMFQRISRLLDPRKGRGFFNTYNAKYPFLRWPLDHIFHSSDFGLIKIKRLPKIGSDHFPMFIELAFIKDDFMEPFVDEADEEEMKEANEKIEVPL